MPRRFIAGMAVVATAALSAQAKDVLTTLKLGLRPAQAGVLDAIVVGSVATRLAADAFKALPASARAAVAADAIVWIKSYTTSPAFKQAYAARREERRPRPPAFAGSVDDELKKQDDEQARQLAQTRKELEKLAPEVRKRLEETLAEGEKQRQNPGLQQLRREGLELQRKQSQGRYQGDLKQWEADLPVDPNVLIARRLRAFLDTSAKVNFDAPLDKKDGRMTFVDPALEQQTREWKLCYRAGREAVAAARTAAEVWLSELK